MDESHVRVALRDYRRRNQRARAALDHYLVRFAQLAGPMSIEAMTELIAEIDRIRTLLDGEEEVEHG
jgi:hypothetical protein